MLKALRWRPNTAPTYRYSDLAAVFALAVVVALWAAVADRSFSWRALLACEAAFFAFYMVGSLFAGWGALATGVLFDLPLRLLLGYAAVNTALFALAWVSPLGIAANFALVFVVAASLFMVARPQRLTSNRADSVGLLALALSILAATLWCQDTIRPTVLQNDNLVFRPWIDGFYHAVHVRIFGDGHGRATLEDWRMAGIPARLYHYGIYLTPALIKHASGMHSYAAFAGILAPLGVLFTGLAAYALFGTFWGPWPGLTACAALLLLPDGAQQGMQNPFMSYSWLSQISPGVPYGVALLGAAWLFVILGCQRGSVVQLAAGWLVGGVVIVYKAHFFIASAFLLLLVPTLFFRRPLGLRKRLLWVAAALAVYLVALVLVQKVPGVPPVVFDGSSIAPVMKLIKGFTTPGPLRAFLDEHVGMASPLSANLFLGGPFVLIAALGLFVPIVVVLVVRLRSRTFPLMTWFPLLLIANFMAMFLGLALDFSSSTPDELSHRPFVLMYFGVVTWVGGAAGHLLFESQRLARFARPAVIAVAAVLLVTPLFFGANVHRMWAMPMFSGVPVPTALVQVTDFLREHSDARDVFQDSGFDRTYTMAALAERRTFVSHTLTRVAHNSDLVDERSDAIERFMRLRDPEVITGTARRLGFQWFLLDPDDRVDWPDPVVSRPTFERSGFRLYRF
jgi:hypothetical protein